MNTGKLDPRLNVFREDMAAISLKDKVRAHRYVQGELRQVVAASAPLRVVPRFDAPLSTEALAGELVTIYQIEHGWGWAQLSGDNYVGYMPIDTISTMIDEPTHWVSARATFVYPAPDLKRPPIMRLSFNTKVTAIGREGRFLELARGGYVFSGHLATSDDYNSDFVRQAEKLIGTPYLWGGRTSNGLDCSALVQLALEASGMSAPRDSDMQEGELGVPILGNNIDHLRRGDFVFWRGHVAIAQSSEWLIHASGHQMEVVVEPVRRAIERIASTHGDVTSIRRIPDLEKRLEAKAEKAEKTENAGKA